MDPLAIARYGMMSAQQELARSAERVVQQPDHDPGAEMIARQEARVQFAFSAKIVAFDAAMWRALLTLQR